MDHQYCIGTMRCTCVRHVKCCKMPILTKPSFPLNVWKLIQNNWRQWFLSSKKQQINSTNMFEFSELYIWQSGCMLSPSVVSCESIFHGSQMPAQTELDPPRSTRLEKEWSLRDQLEPCQCCACAKTTFQGPTTNGRTKATNKKK